MTTKRRIVQHNEWHWVSFNSPQTASADDTDTVSAEFTRPRPVPLTDTLLTKQEVRFNPQGFTATGMTSGSCPANISSAGGVNTVSSPTSSDENTAAQLARSRFTGDLGDFGETIFTLGEASDMIRRRSIQVYQLLRALKTGDWASLGRSLKGDVPKGLKSLPASKRLADGYLEVQFGWLPLIQDIHTVIDLHRSAVVIGQSVKRTSRVDGPAFSGGAVPSEWGHSGLNPGALAPSNSRAKLRAVVQNANMATLNQMGLLNPALIAWQVTRLSFLLDWFLPVGMLLKNLSSDFGLTPLRGSTSSTSVIIQGYKRAELGGAVVPYSSSKTITRKPYVNSVLFDPNQTAWLSARFNIGKAITSVALMEQFRGASRRP